MRAIIREEAFVYRQLRWAGYKYRDRRVWLRGDIVCSGPTKGGVYGCRDWWTNTLMLSSYHIAPNTAESYLRALSDFDPVLIQAYPSSIHALASWMLANNVSYAGKSLRSIVTSSETLDPDTQKQIEQVFGCKVFDWYGQAERVTAIATCEYGRHHMLTDYGLVELYPEGNDLYELVGTSYNNLTMPLMHYRTGDLVRKFDEECPCGRIFPVITEILGRRDKIVTLPDGRQIGRLDHIFKGLDSIFEGQIAYQGKGHFSIRISVTSDWKDSDADHLIRQLTERISNITASVDIVDSIPRGANGKFEFVRIEEDQ
ncbi:putative adenylate-forming enzyme [compost metagenome]